MVRQGWINSDDFNPRPPCGGRPFAPMIYTGPQLISIHVLRVEDDRKFGSVAAQQLISIHVLRVEDDVIISV